MRFIDSMLPIAILLASFFVAPCSAQQWSGNSQQYPTTQQTMSLSQGDANRSIVPGPPTQPTVASRPTSWPGSPPPSSPWPRPTTQAALPPVNEMTPCRGTRIIARVGSDAILESEVAGAVNEIIEKNKDKIPPDQIDRQRDFIIQKMLPDLMKLKMVYQDAKRTIPAEGWSNVEKQLSKYFEESELPKMMKKAGVSSPHELDQKYRSLGTSLEREKRTAMERSLAQEWIKGQVKTNQEITPGQLVAYYREHIDEFTTPARAKYEEIVVRYSKYPTKTAAFEAIARMGNQVVAGAPLAQVAKRDSDGFTASNGGQSRWTSKGALAAEALDAALFNLPPRTAQPDHPRANRIPHHPRDATRRRVHQAVRGNPPRRHPQENSRPAHPKTNARVSGETGSPNSHLDNLRPEGRQSPARQSASPPAAIRSRVRETHQNSRGRDLVHFSAHTYGYGLCVSAENMDLSPLHPPLPPLANPL